MWLVTISMRKYLIFIFFILFTIISAQDKIFWNENTSLKWEDFQAKPNIKKVAALSYCGIQFYSCEESTRRNPVYRIRAYFMPSKSWSWSNYRYSYVLKHEQLHFDIAELYTRKIRKYFSENLVKMENAVIEYQSIFNEYTDYQELYDEETHHGTKDHKQKDWELSIQSQMKELEMFKEDVCY